MSSCCQVGIKKLYITKDAEWLLLGLFMNFMVAILGPFSTNFQKLIFSAHLCIWQRNKQKRMKNGMKNNVKNNYCEPHRKKIIEK